MSMPWVKVYTEMMDDVKLSKLTDEQKWRFVQLILLAATCDAAGAFVIGESLMTHSDMSWRLRIDIEILEKDIKRMLEVDLLEEVDGMLIVKKFAERQGPTQAHKREQWRKLQNSRRDRIKNSNVINESLMTHAGVINIDKDKDKDKDYSRQSRGGDLKHLERQALIKFFLTKTGLPSPRDEVKMMQKLWWSPIDEILKFSGGVDTAQDVIDRSVTRMRVKELSISDPNSILKTARAIYGEMNKPGAASTFTEVY